MKDRDKEFLKYSGFLFMKVIYVNLQSNFRKYEKENIRLFLYSGKKFRL